VSADAVGVGPLRNRARDFKCLAFIPCSAKHTIPRLIRRSSIRPAVGNFFYPGIPKPSFFDRPQDADTSVEPLRKSLGGFGHVKVAKVAFYTQLSNPGSPHQQAKTQIKSGNETLGLFGMNRRPSGLFGGHGDYEGIVRHLFNSAAKLGGAKNRCALILTNALEGDDGFADEAKDVTTLQRFMNGYKITIVRVFRIDVWANDLVEGVRVECHPQSHSCILRSI
jgi:hypothetical protein